MTIDEISEDRPGIKRLTDDTEDDVDGHRLGAVDPEFDRQRVQHTAEDSDEKDDTEGHIRPE